MFHFLKEELISIIKTKKLFISIIAVLFMPIIYCGIFLWAFWDPYDQLDQLPVAIVNEDKGANFQGEPLNIGKDMIENIKDNKELNWDVVSKAIAEKGMEEQKYYLLIEIPKDFSENAMTILHEKPKKLAIRYVSNKSLNYLAGTIGDGAIDKIAKDVSTHLTESYIKSMVTQWKSVSIELENANEELTSSSEQLRQVVQSHPHLKKEQKAQMMQIVRSLSGASELANKLKQSADISDHHIQMMADPVNVRTEEYAEVPNYGTGFTPFSLSLGLFLGAFMLSIVYPLRHPANTPKSAFNWFIGKFGVMAFVGIIQALIANVVLVKGLGLEVTKLSHFILFTIFTALVFTTLVQFLVTVFGEKGRFLIILILILQIATSVGTFPIELIPRSLQHISTFMPMTYTISGFRSVISSGNDLFMWQAITILSIFIVVSMFASFVFFHFKYKKYANDEGIMKVVTK